MKTPYKVVVLGETRGTGSANSHNGQCTRRPGEVNPRAQNLESRDTTAISGTGL